jgi:hypothetical protein
MQFGPCGQAHISASYNSAQVNLTHGTITIEAGANAQFHLMAQENGIITLPVPLGSTYWPNINILGAVAFSTAFITASSLGMAQMHYQTMAGQAFVTGPRYNANMNGIVESIGGGATYFPGTAAGTIANGGQYQ